MDHSKISFDVKFIVMVCYGPVWNIQSSVKFCANTEMINRTETRIRVAAAVADD